jgi:hypothetical protein
LSIVIVIGKLLRRKLIYELGIRVRVMDKKRNFEHPISLIKLRSLGVLQSDIIVEFKL